MTVRPREAAPRFFGEPHEISPCGASSGFSGSTFARVETAGASWCLRGWPAGFEAERLRFIHRALRHSRASGFSGVVRSATTRDEGATMLDLGDRLFDAQEWLPGEPLSGRPAWDVPVPNVVRPLSQERLSSLTGALARFHRSTVDFGVDRRSRGGRFGRCSLE